MKTGVFKSLIALLFKTAKLLSICSIAVENISLTLFKISNSGTYVLPIELLKGDKTTSWLGIDFTKITFVLCLAKL